jgi:diguanylate cyclase (GGDEF)-like protein
VRGADVASLDAAYFGEILARRRPTAARITILDGRHRVLASADPELARQGTLPQEVAGRLEMAASGAVFSYFPSPNGSRESRLGIDLRHAALYRLGDPALAVLVDLPAVALHPALLPLAYQILTFLFLTLLLLFGVIASFGRRVSEPLAVLESASREIARGSVPPEVLLTRLADSPIAEIRSLAADFSSMQHALAYRDATTGLPNRQLFSHLLGRTLAKAAGEGREVAVVAIDLDGSRLLQESLGQDGGARLLAEVAHRIAASAGAEDAAGRLGPDVFALARAGAGAAAEAAAAIDALQAGLAPPIRIGGREIFVTASIGASLFPADGRDVETLLANASAAVERVKEQGKDGATLFSPELAGRGRDRLALESDLRRAVERGELSIHYQPVVELARGSIIGMEAFVRWTHPERGPIAPAEFIPVAERSDLIARIDCWVFETAARQLAAWRAESLPPLTLAVNLSSRQFQRPDLVAYLSGVLERLELPASCLAVELTESAAIQHPRRSVEVLSRLRELGVEVCLDDFGTGYSSLSQLQRLPVDVLKLDRSFVAGLTDDPADAAIAGAVLALARSLGLRVVAEGVETREQLDDLRRRGCHSVQGFLLGEPLPAEDFALLVRADLGLPAAAEA